MGAASASGENRAIEAAQKAISSPLLEDISIQGARGVLINITGGPDLCLHEVNEAASMIQEEAHDDANIIFGAVIDESMTDEIRITVIATGFGEVKEEKKAGAGSGACARTCRTSPTRRQKNKKVVHLGTIVDDLDTPTWQRKKQGSDEVETVTLNKTSFQFSGESGRRRQVRHPDVSAPADGLRRLARSHRFDSGRNGLRIRAERMSGPTEFSARALKHGASAFVVAHAGAVLDRERDLFGTQFAGKRLRKSLPR